MSTTVAAAPHSSLSSPPLAMLQPAPLPERTRPQRRSTTFIQRRQRVALAPFLTPLRKYFQAFEPAAWFHAVARALMERSAGAPQRGLERLTLAGPTHQSAACYALLQELSAKWPANVWNELSLLGEVLNQARASADTGDRVGRSGRISTGTVYTPAAVARAVIQEIHVGARRVVDPACGAGVFLLEAFERAFVRRVENGATPLDAARDALTLELSGVDTDPTALAVAEFSLRLAAFRHAGLSDDTPLDLRCQDALDALPGLDGQCECVVGNPPYIEGRGLSAGQLNNLRERFRCAASGKVNLFAAFVERSLTLLKNDGVLALILPATFQRNARYKALRELLLENTIESIQPLDPDTFGNHVVETVVLRVRKRPPVKGWRVALAEGRRLQAQLPLGPVLCFSDKLSTRLRKQIEAMERHGVPLSDCFDVRDGISTGFQPFPQRLLGQRENDAFRAADGTCAPFDPAVHRPIIDGSEFHAYTPVRWAGRYIEYDKRHEHQPPHPGRPFNCQLRELSHYDRPGKIVSRQTGRGLIATLDRERFLVRNSVHVTFPRTGHEALSLEALCACMNSTLYAEYLLAISGETGAVFPQVHIADIRRLPILPGLLRADGGLALLGAKVLGTYLGGNTMRAMELKEEIESLLRAAFGAA